MIDIFKKLVHIFRKEDRSKFLLFGAGILLNSFLEVIGIGLIMPFIALLSKPDLLTTNPLIHKAYTILQFHSFQQFMVIIAVGIICVYVLKGVLLFFASYWQSRFIFEKQTFLGARLFSAYLMSPYSFHLKESLAKLQRNLSVISGIMQCIVLQVFNMLTNAFLVMSLFIVLLCAQTILTLTVVLILGMCFFLYFSFLRKKLSRWGEVSMQHSTLVGQQINQGLGSIKETKLFGKEEFFVDRYRYHSEQVALQMSKIDVVSKSPRLFIEMIVVSLVMLAIIIYLNVGQSPDRIFKMVSLFAIVAIRLMPSLNQISTAWSSIKAYTPIFNEVYNDIVNCERFENSRRQQEGNSAAINFQKNIEMKDVSFSYESAHRLALDHVSFSIPKNSTVGFVGPSGAGKTTLIDLILGLLKPSSGKILVDGADIHQSLRSWQDTIGYIPQAIYLCDDKIKNNVAFGLQEDQIDDQKVWHALHLAQLDEFVHSLPQGIETAIGERGIRLSGGQRQRIGIARALYNDPQLLVMDEATAALDNETERSFMEALTNLSGAKTILIIAHRLTTVRKCDAIFFFKNGKLVSTGPYDHLFNHCPEFSQMAGLGAL